MHLVTAAINLKAAVLSRLGREEKSSENSADKVQRRHPKHLREE